ncbi:MAG: 50S ribosomal protein L17 [candidate division KSB1 bacterium]|nr:50S ribosomal protein L17 [candidate division KSB1 bacterium]
MRHRKVGRGLSRSPAHRKAVLRNLAISLIEHKGLITTVAKAKEVRPFVERILHFGKRGDLAARRHVLRLIPNKKAVGILFHEIAPQLGDRAGGYTRIIRLGNRRGDGAEMAMLELVGYEGTIVKRQEKAKEEREKRKAEKEKKLKEKEAAPKQEEE